MLTRNFPIFPFSKSCPHSQHNINPILDWRFFWFIFFIHHEFMWYHCIESWTQEKWAREAFSANIYDAVHGGFELVISDFHKESSQINNKMILFRFDRSILTINLYLQSGCHESAEYSHKTSISMSWCYEMSLTLSELVCLYSCNTSWKVLNSAQC